MTARDPSSAFGSILRRLRLAAALSQEELAERAGVSVRGLGDLERGVHRAPRLETVRLLADALQLEEQPRAEFLAAARPQFAAPAPPAAAAEQALPETVLPRPLTRLIGRKAEVVAVSGLLTQDDHRLVTLTGPGGVGKTRLALAVAKALADSFADGVAFVDLAPVRDPGLVTSAVAAALGTREAGPQSIAERLATSVRERDMLLILDNFEQVLDAAPLVSDLLVIAPGLRILATSREPLRVSGEQVYPVGPLAIPHPGQPIDAEGTELPDAVTLFVQRARAADPDFALAADNATAVTGIVRRLDGLPLAIELAAARVRVLPAPLLLIQFEHQSLPLLTGGPRDQPDRQRTMRDTIAWSYDLLSPSERRLFRTLSVFVGGFTLEAAMAVAGAHPDTDLLDGVASLVDKSLLRRMTRGGGEPGFAALETIREFGFEQLAASGEEIPVRNAHAAWVIALVEQAEAALEGTEQGRWLERLEADLPNLRAALGWLQQSGDVATRLRVAGALQLFWYIHGHVSEGRACLEGALADGMEVSPALRIKPLVAASVLALGQADYRASLAFAQECEAIAERVGDRRGSAAAHLMLGMSPQMQGDYATSVARLEEAVARWRQIDDKHWLAITLTQLGQAVFGLPDLERSAALHEEALTVMQEVGGPWSRAVVLGSLGNVVLEQGDVARAEHLLRESLALRRDIDDQRFAAETLASLAIAAERKGQLWRAARLIGAVDGVCGRIHLPLMDTPAQAARYAQTIDATRARLGDEVFGAARAAGRSLALAEAVNEAMIAPAEAKDGSLDWPRPTGRTPSGHTR